RGSASPSSTSYAWCASAAPSSRPTSRARLSSAINLLTLSLCREHAADRADGTLSLSGRGDAGAANRVGTSQRRGERVHVGGRVRVDGGLGWRAQREAAVRFLVNGGAAQVGNQRARCDAHRHRLLNALVGCCLDRDRAELLRWLELGLRLWAGRCIGGRHLDQRRLCLRRLLGDVLWEQVAIRRRGEQR